METTEKAVDGFRFLPPGLSAWIRTYIPDEDFQEAIPWTPLAKPLSDTTIALITSAGISLKSDTPFFQRSLAHINFFIPISAGMWGAKGKNGKPPIPDIQEKMEIYCNNWFGCDEAFLTKEVWPEFRSQGYFKVHNYSEIIIIFLVVVGIVFILWKLFSNKSPVRISMRW